MDHVKHVKLLLKWCWKEQKLIFSPQCLEELKLPPLGFGFCKLYNANWGYQVSTLYFCLFLCGLAVYWHVLSRGRVMGDSYRCFMIPHQFSWQPSRISRTSTVLPQCHQSSCLVFVTQHRPSPPNDIFQRSTRKFWRIVFGFYLVKGLLNMSTLTDGVVPSLLSLTLLIWLYVKLSLNSKQAHLWHNGAHFSSLIQISFFYLTGLLIIKHCWLFKFRELACWFPL